MGTDNLLAELRKHSSVVPETAELDTLRRLKTRHVNLSAARLTAAAQLPEHYDIVDEALLAAQKKLGKAGNRKRAAMHAVELLPVAFGKCILQHIDGHVSIEVDGRLAYKRRATIDRARSLIDAFEEAGVSKDRILLKIPATWEGIEAAAKLREKNDIRCHMSLVFGMHQLAACADAGAALVAPSVGRITDWHKKNDGVDSYSPSQDPGVALAAEMYRYLQCHGYSTQLMPSMFRNPEQAIALAGCDLIGLPTKLIELLEQQSGTVKQQLDPNDSSACATDKLAIDNTAFSTLHSADPISQSKLLSGVKNLSWAIVSQEKQLVEWINKRQDEAAESSTAKLFQTWDYDGDGFIDREEWNGSEAVFNALDRDHNGRISLEEMAAGLGSPFRPDDD